jgi:5-methylcytosine-specific restriction endonuclease McrA
MKVRALVLPKVPARHCRWCEVEITLGRRDRTFHDGRGDEPDCSYEFRLHTRREVQFAYVEHRDGLKCWDCGAAPEKWLRDARGALTYIGGSSDFTDRDGVTWVAGTHFCRVERVTALELEHDVPLWRTTHLSDAERRRFFGPENLRLRCKACHGPKTAQEAKARAKEKRQADKLGPNATHEPKPPWRRIRSKGFDKTLRRRMNGAIERRA